MKIFLDTSILIKEGYLRSETARTFLKAAKILDIGVCLPEVTYDELLGRVKIEINKQSDAAEKAIKKLINLTDKNFASPDPKEFFSNYENWLDELLDQNKVEILNYPDISPKEIVEASYIGKKPFKPRGEGYKDYLIWHTLLELTNKESREEFVFLTKNTHDFCDEKSTSPTLHPDLVKQLGKNIRVQVIKDLRLLLNEIIAQKLGGANPQDIPASISATTKKIVEELLTGYSAYGFEGLPIGNDVTISYVDNVMLGQLVFKSFGNDEILVKFEGKVTAEFSGFIDKSEYYLHYEIPDVNICDSNWNDRVMLTSSVAELDFEGELILEKKSKKITSREVNLPTEIGVYDY